MATAGHKSQVNVSGAPVLFSGESTTVNDDLTIYQINDALKRVWDRTADITVERSTDGGSTWKTLDPEADGYSIDRLFGQVKFENPRNAGTEIQLSGSYLPMSKAAGAYEYSYSLEADNQDKTEFGATFTEREQGLVDFSGSISRFYETNSFFFDALSKGDVVVIEFYIDHSRPPILKGWALFSSDEPDAAVDGLVEESIDFEGTTDAEQRSVSIG